MISSYEKQWHVVPRYGMGSVCRSLLVLMMSVVFVEICFAQTDSVPSPAVRDATLWSVATDDGLTALQAAGHVLTAPAQWGGGDWVYAGGVVGGTAVGFVLDNKAADLMRRNQSSFNDDATNIAVEYGSGAVAIGAPAVMYLAGLLVKEPWLRETGLLAGTTIVLTSTITTAAKIVVGRARPYENLGHSFFRPFNGHDGFMSFPSGHTTAAFSLSAVLAARIKNPWASVGLYGLATGAALSRVYARDHWLSDIVFTAAYTSAVANSVVTWFENDRKSGENTHSLSIVPAMNGIRVIWQL